jgi:hypothetical protein
MHILTDLENGQQSPWPVKPLDGFWCNGSPINRDINCSPLLGVVTQIDCLVFGSPPYCRITQKAALLVLPV